MFERWKKPDYASNDLAKKRPLVVRAIYTRNPEVKRKAQALQGEGVNLVFQRMQRTPYDVRDALHPEDRAPAILRDALLEPSTGNRSKVRKTIDSSLRFKAVYTTREQRTVIDEMNHAIKPQREKYARRRLLYDRTLDEQKDLRRSAWLLIAAALAATGLQVEGLDGPELFVAQSTDDGVALYATAKSEKGGKKGIKQIARENKIGIAAIGAAAVLDNFNAIIPHLIQSPSLPLRLLGGGLTFAAATAGSVSANTMNVVRSKREIQEKSEGEITRTEAWKQAWKQNTSHPFRKFLCIGTGLSAAAFEYAATKGVLLGESYSAVLQTVLGQLETITAFGGLYLASGAASMKDHVVNWVTVKRGKQRTK